MTLANYLKTLNTAESQWGLWVNPNDVDEYRIGQFIFENGGLLDDWICVGSLEELSFGAQSRHDAFACWVSKGMDSEVIPKTNQTITYQDKSVVVNPEALYEKWIDEELDENFSKFIDDEIDSILSEWAEYEADDFVSNKLPDIIKSASDALVY